MVFGAYPGTGSIIEGKCRLEVKESTSCRCLRNEVLLLVPYSNLALFMVAAFGCWRHFVTLLLDTSRHQEDPARLHCY